SVSSGVQFVIAGQLTTAQSGPPLNGAVALLDNGTGIATSTLAGEAAPYAISFTLNTATQPLSAGTHVLSLSFSPSDSFWHSSSSSNLTITVGAVATVSLNSNLSSSLVALPGSNVQF